jgi:aryl-alcohol dehydrogenase-like predicted oxidoreductase
MTFGGTGDQASIGQTDVAAARRQLTACMDAGINLIDTADMYSQGLAEEILGEAMTGLRDDLLIATKARMPMGDGPNDAGLSRHHIIRSCEASLRRLNTDHIDLYQVHEWDGHTPLEETLTALDDLVRAGKVRYIGASNFSGWHMMKALGVSDQRQLERFVSHQIYYSLNSREVEYELVPVSVDQGVGILAWSPLAGGLLTGKYRRDSQPPGGRHTLNWGDPPTHDLEKLYRTIDVLVQIADAHECSPAQVALAWLLTRPAVASLVIGARTDEQLADNLKAVELVLSDEEATRITQASSMPLYYPYWHQAETASDRLGPGDLSLIEQYLPYPPPRPADDSEVALEG